MKLYNTTKSDLGLATGQVVPANSHIEIDEEELARNEGSLVVETWVAEGKLSKKEPTVGEAAAPVETREEAVEKAIMAVLDAGGDGLAADGRPKVEAVSIALVAADKAPTTSAERDAIWETIRQRG